MSELTPELLLRGYRQGVFPMADPDDDWSISWFSPARRGVIPLDRFHIPHDLARIVRQQRFAVETDRDFEAVMRACADRESTWISEEIVQAYCRLHELGYAHSVECRKQGKLAGGLYGVALGGAFFGESMFHRERDASKVALVHLVDRLRAGRFKLLDVQYVTPHLAQFGAVEISRLQYQRLLAAALTAEAVW